MLCDYFNKQFSEDLSKIGYIEPNKDALLYSSELSRGMRFIDISTIDVDEIVDKENFIFVLFILMTLDQICYTYFSFKKYEVPLYGHFGMGQAAHVDSPRDFLIEIIDLNIIKHKVKQKNIDCYCDFMISLAKELIDEGDMNTTIYQFFLHIFSDKDMNPSANDVNNIGDIVFQRFYETLLGKIKKL